MAQYDDINSSKIITSGVISLVTVAVTALAVQVIFYALADWQDTAKSEQSQYLRENTALAEQKQQISVFGVDPQTGNITIPIDKAMEMVVNESKNKKTDAQDQTKHDET
jgi:hypothetical protein